MTRPQPTVRRMVGTSDLSWILFVGASATIVTSLLLGHLRVEFETYRVANARAALSRASSSLACSCSAARRGAAHRGRSPTARQAESACPAL